MICFAAVRLTEDQTQIPLARCLGIAFLAARLLFGTAAWHSPEITFLKLKSRYVALKILQCQFEPPSNCFSEIDAGGLFSRRTGLRAYLQDREGFAGLVPL